MEECPGIDDALEEHGKILQTVGANRGEIATVMLTQSEWKTLSEKYSHYGSWAVWNPTRWKDTSVVSENLRDLKTSVIVVGLNCSGHWAGGETYYDTDELLQQHKGWRNFHGGKQDYKLAYALNWSPYRGAYLTDIIKGEFNVDSGNVKKKIARGEIKIETHLIAFRDEMDDWKVRPNALFILLGDVVRELFEDYLGRFYKNRVQIRHYAARPHRNERYTDAKYVEGVWQKLERHYENTKAHYNTLPFERNTSMRRLLKELSASKKVANRRSKGYEPIPINGKRSTPSDQARTSLIKSLLPFEGQIIFANQPWRCCLCEGVDLGKSIVCQLWFVRWEGNEDSSEKRALTLTIERELLTSAPEKNIEWLRSLFLDNWLNYGLSPPGLRISKSRGVEELA